MIVKLSGCAQLVAESTAMEANANEMAASSADLSSADSGLQSGQDSRMPLEGKLLARRWRRRRDISCVDGLIREHGRLIAKIENDRVSLAKAEVLSRAYGRHREMVAAKEEIDYLRDVAERFEQYQKRPQLQNFCDYSADASMTQDST